MLLFFLPREPEEGGPRASSARGGGGFAAGADSAEDMLKDRVQVFENIFGAYSQDENIMLKQPSVTLHIPLRLVAP